ncbi:hypothetical protein E2P81_ATG09148 [Venturia nashicola]|nr:hypothetical protein E2P81_ATG09148 [Venturia nashicola]
MFCARKGAGPHQPSQDRPLRFPMSDEMRFPLSHASAPGHMLMSVLKDATETSLRVDDDANEAIRGATVPLATISFVDSYSAERRYMESHVLWFDCGARTLWERNPVWILSGKSLSCLSARSSCRALMTREIG